MRTPILVITSFFLTYQSYANKIEKLANYNEVKNFLIKKISKDFKNDKLFKNTNYKSDTTFEERGFSKFDIDKNGLTDLVVHGLITFVVLDKGKSGYILKYLDNNSMNKTKLINIDTSQNICKFITQNRIKKNIRLDTLVYRFKNFIEFNNLIDENFKLESIKFKTNRCIEKCPIFEININNDKSATYDAIEFNERKGKFKGFINKDEFKELIEILKYINLEKLENYYEVDWYDDQTVTIEVKYNGKTKIIKDYGMIGTFGLTKLYSKFFFFRNKIEWSE